MRLMLPAINNGWTGVKYIYEYLTLAIGAGLLVLGNASETGAQKVLSNSFYTFGAFGIYAAALSLSSYEPTQNVLWEILCIVIAAAGLYFARTVQNRSLLKITALFIFVLIGKFTVEYFSDSFGWPFALIIGGIAMMAAGYGVVRLGKRVK